MNYITGCILYPFIRQNQFYGCVQNLLQGVILLLLAASCNNTGQHSTANATLYDKLEKAITADSVTITPKEFNTEDYDNIVENNFVSATENSFSTFSIDVDAAAYSNVRRYLQSSTTPLKGAVRIEALINYFDYGYTAPQNEEPFALYAEIAACSWNQKHRLVHIGLKGKEVLSQPLPAANLVFLINVSGSMNEEKKLPL